MDNEGLKKYISNLDKISNALYWNDLAETDLSKVTNSDIARFRELSENDRSFIDKDSLKKLDAFINESIDKMVDKVFKLLVYFVEKFFTWSNSWYKCSLLYDYCLYTIDLNPPKDKTLFFTTTELKTFKGIDFIDDFKQKDWDNFCSFKSFKILDYVLKYGSKYVKWGSENSLESFALAYFILSKCDFENNFENNSIIFHISVKAYEKGYRKRFLDNYDEYNEWADSLNKKYPKLNLNTWIRHYLHSEIK